MSDTLQLEEETIVSGDAVLSLGDRMKDHEVRARTFLPRGTNIIIRLDGVGFSKFTKGLDRPFDADFINAMDETAKELCSRIQGAKCAFVQSDEITILVTDYDSITSAGWYDNQVQKMCSVAAGIATARFNRVFKHKTTDTEGYFDARVFSVGYAEEVVNCFLWRQQDCTRNSISSVAQVLYSHTELNGKKSDGPGGKIDMIFDKSPELIAIMTANGTLPEELKCREKINWADLPTGMKRGRFITNQTYMQTERPVDAHPRWQPGMRNRWVAEGAPIFSQDRRAILCLLPNYIPVNELN